MPGIEWTITPGQAIITLALGYMAWEYRQTRKGQDRQSDKLERVRQEVYGGDSEVVDGIVDVVEMHDDELSDHDARLQEYKQRLETLANRQRQIRQRVNSIKEVAEQRLAEDGDLDIEEGDWGRWNGENGPRGHIDDHWSDGSADDTAGD